MSPAVLSTPFEPAALAAADTATLKSSLLKQVEGRDTYPMAKKVRFASETLMPIFNELASRNPTPDLSQQVPLLKGIWFPVWSTIPFQDILPGRVHQESYQIFDDNGYYANLARYKPGLKAPLLGLVSRWLLSYDFMIMQTYSVAAPEPGEVNLSAAAEHPAEEYWDIQNVAIRQALRFGSPALSPEAAQTWFNQTVANYQKNLEPQQQTPIAARGRNRVSAKQYQQISKAKPRLDHLYIDQDFRLVKTQREKSQRPSYTVATRLT
jgi:hypothetical protein